MRKPILVLVFLGTAATVSGQTAHRTQANVAGGRTATSKPSRKPKPAPKPSRQWQLVSSNARLEIYYQPASVQSVNPTTLRVWTKKIPVDLEAARKDKANAFTDDEQTANRYLASYSYSLELLDLRCRARESRLHGLVDYAEDGTTLVRLGDEDSPPGWSKIIPDSIMDVLRRKICPK